MRLERSDMSLRVNDNDNARFCATGLRGGRVEAFFRTNMQGGHLGWIMIRSEVGAGQRPRIDFGRHPIWRWRMGIETEINEGTCIFTRVTGFVG